MTTYHQNAKGEAFYMFHWMSLSPEEVVLHERAANYEGRELTVNCEAPIPTTGNKYLPLLNHMDTQGKALWETIIGREQENNIKLILFTSLCCTMFLLVFLQFITKTLELFTITQ